MRISKVVLSFDDGRSDNYTIAVNLLKKLGIPATFNIATAYIDDSISIANRPCENKAMTIDNLKELSDAGFEIACHGDQHRNELKDIKRGLSKLRKWLKMDGNGKLGFASPRSNLAEKEIRNYRQEFDKIGISYVRIGILHPHSISGKILRKIVYITGSANLFKLVYSSSLDRLDTEFVIHSIPIIKNTTLEQIQSLIWSAVHYKKDCILMFHSILRKDDKFYGDIWTWDYQKFESLCNWLLEMQKKGIINITTVKNAMESCRVD